MARSHEAMASTSWHSYDTAAAECLGVSQATTAAADMRGCGHLYSSPTPWRLWNWGLSLADNPCFHRNVTKKMSESKHSTILLSSNSQEVLQVGNFLKDL